MLRRIFIALPLYAQQNIEFDRWLWRMEIERMRQDTPERRRLQKQQDEAERAVTLMREQLRAIYDLDKALHAAHAALIDPRKTDGTAMETLHKQAARVARLTK